MAQKIHSKRYCFCCLLLLLILFAGCRKNLPQVVVITPTSVPTVASTPAIDPTIASVLTQAAPTIMVEATAGAQEIATLPTETPEFVCELLDDWIAYSVQPNDTLYTIASNLGITVDEIKVGNCMLVDLINVGEILYLPSFPFSVQSPGINQLPDSFTDAGQTLSNANFSLDSASTILPEGAPRELGFFPGGGGGGYYGNCLYLDERPDRLFVTTRPSREKGYDGRPLLMMEVCNPTTKNITITLALPSGETVSPKVNIINDIIHSTYFELPWGYPYGEYDVSFDFPDKAETFSIIPEKYASPVISRSKFVQNENYRLVLFHFEPYETVHLLAYGNPSEKFKKFVGTKTYQVNGNGYLIIEISPYLSWNSSGFIALGELSGYVTEYNTPRLVSISNNGPEPVCGLWLKKWEEDWRYVYGPLNTSSNDLPIEVGETIMLILNIHSADVLYLEVWDCNNEVVQKLHRIELESVIQPEIQIYQQPGLTSEVLTPIGIGNDGWESVCQVLITPASKNEWNELFEAPLQIGETWSGQVMPGNYDLEARNCEGEIIASVSSFSPPFSNSYWIIKEVTFSIVNNGSESICELWITPTGENEWSVYNTFASPLDNDGFLLIELERLELGETGDIYIGQGIYDLEARNCSSEVLASTSNFEIQEGAQWEIP